MKIFLIGIVAGFSFRGFLDLIGYLGSKLFVSSTPEMDYELSNTDLEEKIKFHLDNEDYENAAICRDALNKRKKMSNQN